MKNRKSKGMCRATCPKCGYRMPVFYNREAASEGVFVPCKGRRCGAFFEVKIENGIQVR